MSGGDEKLDPFSTQVQDLPGADEEGADAKETKEAKTINPRVVIAAATVAFVCVVVAISYMGVRAEDDIQSRRQAQLEAEGKEFVEIDEASARMEAKRRMSDSERDREAAKEFAGNEPIPKDVAAQPEADVLVVPGQPVVPGDPSAPGPIQGAPTSPSEPDPWVVARKQYIAAQAQQHYTLMAQARMAPIFKGDGVVSESGASQARGVGAPGRATLPEPESREEAEFLARVQQAQDQTTGYGASSGSRPGAFSVSAPSSPESAPRRATGGRGSFVTSTTPGSSNAVCVASARCVQAGTVVQAVLATDINSELPGMIIAQVVQPVWDPTLTRIVIPSGSKILGEYDTGVEPGQTRAQVAWTRLILNTGESVELDRFPGASLGGASGVAGEVDDHWDKLLAGAALSSVFAASASALSGPVNQLSIDPRQQAITGGVRPLQELGEDRAQTYLKVGPTLRVSQGSRVGMLVPKDLLLPARRLRGVFGEGTR